MHIKLHKPLDPKDARRIRVCANCLCASCWLGEFYCEKYKTAGTKVMTVKELRKINRESPSYWDRAEER